MKHAAALLLASALAAPALAAETAPVAGSAPSLEAAVLDYKAQLAREFGKGCREATFSRGFAAHLDLNGDGRPDAILSARFMDCPSGALARSGEGSLVRFALSRADGSYATRDGVFVKVEPVLDAGGFQLLLTRTGAACNIPAFETLASEACAERVRFDGEAMTRIGWEEAAPATASAAAPASRYAALPGRPAAKLPPPGVPTASFGGGDPFDHNGSVVRIDMQAGTIVYDNPKPAMRGLVRTGTVLFEGRIDNPGAVRGTAYAFKDGCPPAPYAVQGHYAGGSASIVLRGMGPSRWAGCEVVAYSERSPHAKLAFDLIIPD